MQVNKGEGKWQVIIEEQDNKLGLINMIRHLDRVIAELEAAKIPNLQLEMDLAKLNSANSELIAKFVELQSILVRTDGRLSVINANPELKSSFDVVMLDKIVPVQYIGQTGDEESYEYDEFPDDEE
ncbi:MAG: hypothetical protein N2Z22_04075 [Turneriella sp.]|nr:hypothetical protein [Turneriella sp.]